MPPHGQSDPGFAGLPPAPAPAKSTFVYAGVGRRLLAFLIDCVIITFVYWLIGWATGNTPDGGVGFEFGTGMTLLSIAIWLTYFTVLEATWGRTPGKAALGLWVTGHDGRPHGWVRSFVRNVLRIIDAIPYIIPYLLGAILIWTSRDNQRLGDMAARTVVLRSPEREFNPASGPGSEAPRAGDPSTR